MHPLRGAERVAQGDGWRRCASRESSRRANVCCAFLESEVRGDDESVTWTVRGPTGAEPALALFESLPGRVAAGLTDEEARALLAEMNRALRG